MPPVSPPALPAEPALPPPSAGGASVCERCRGDFHCGIDDPAPCACSTVVLGPAQRRALSGLYGHCLCVRCLAAIAAGAQP